MSDTVTDLAGLLGKADRAGDFRMSGPAELPAPNGKDPRQLRRYRGLQRSADRPRTGENRRPPLAEDAGSDLIEAERRRDLADEATLAG